MFSAFKIKGLTLVDLILTLGLFSLVVGGTTVILSDFLNRSQLQNTSQSIVDHLRRAQGFAMIRYQNSNWGVHFDAAAAQFTLFKGAVFATRDPAFDESENLPDSLTLQSITLNGGGNDVIFNQVLGSTSQNGSLIIREPLANHEITLTINPYGQLEVN